MYAVMFIAIFLFVAWLGLIPNFSEYEATQLIMCIALGLTVVVITGFTMVIKRLDVLCGQKAERDNVKKEEQTEKEDK
ncbi:MAG: hypothetical protein IJB93_02230 [Clostridia bacterium]|nr:hypothetical protein [Clostridia bacterium]